MKPILEIFVPGPVQPERKRQRWNKHIGRPGPRTDEPLQADCKARIAHFAAAVMREAVKNPIRLEITVYREKPASYPKKPTASKPWPWAWVTKPDATNFVKLVEDALNGVAFFDDAQVVDQVNRKRYGPPGVRIVVYALEIEHDLMPLEWQQPQDASSGLSAIAGKWPGDEEIDQELKALRGGKIWMPTTTDVHFRCDRCQTRLNGDGTAEREKS